VRQVSNFEKELLRSAKEALAIAKGEMEPPRVYVPPMIDVAAIRKKLGLSQARFAARFGLSRQRCGIGSRSGAILTRLLAPFSQSLTGTMRPWSGL
jgi:hypothetical protein